MKSADPTDGVVSAGALLLDGAVEPAGADDVLASVDDVLSPAVVLDASVEVDSSTDDDVESSLVGLSLVELSPLAPVDVAAAVTVSVDSAAVPTTMSHVARV